METQSGILKSDSKSHESLVKLQLSETFEATGMLENSVNKEKEGRLVNCQEQDQEEDQISVCKCPC